MLALKSSIWLTLANTGLQGSELIRCTHTPYKGLRLLFTIVSTYRNQRLPKILCLVRDRCANFRYDISRFCFPPMEIRIAENGSHSLKSGACLADTASPSIETYEDLHPFIPSSKIGRRRRLMSKPSWFTISLAKSSVPWTNQLGIRLSPGCISATIVLSLSIATGDIQILTGGTWTDAPAQKSEKGTTKSVVRRSPDAVPTLDTLWDIGALVGDPTMALMCGVNSAGCTASTLNRTRYGKTLCQMTTPAAPKTLQKPVIHRH